VYDNSYREEKKDHNKNQWPEPSQGKRKGRPKKGQPKDAQPA